MRANLVRFLIGLAAGLVLQVATILVWSSIRGDASEFIRVVYRPFFGLSEPFVLHHFGRSDGSLAYYVLGGVGLGGVVYSLAAGVFAVLFNQRTH